MTVIYDPWWMNGVVGSAVSGLVGYEVGRVMLGVPGSVVVGALVAVLAFGVFFAVHQVERVVLERLKERRRGEP